MPRFGGALVAGLLLGCSGPDDTADTEPAAQPTDCLAWADPLVRLEASLGETAARALGIENRCERQLAVDLTLTQPDVDFVIEATSVVLDGGASAEIGVSFSPDVAGELTAEVVATAEGVDDVAVSLAGLARGPAYALTLSQTEAPPVCPSAVTLSVTNTGDGAGKVVGLTVDASGATVEASLPTLPVVLGPGEHIEIDGTFTAALDFDTAAIEVDLVDEYVGVQELAHDIAVEPGSVQDDAFASWANGRPVDLLITVDRSLEEPDWKAGVEAGLAGLLEALTDASVDYRIMPIVDPSGCPLGRQPPVRKTDGAGSVAVAKLLALLDLDFARTSDRSSEHKPFELVHNAMLLANTRTGGCNEWRRPYAGLVALHVTNEDDQSGGSVSEHVSTLRRAVELDDRVGIYAIAGPSGGCETAAEGTRLIEAASDTGGNVRAICGVSWDGAFSMAATAPGDPRRVPLTATPYEPSLIAIPDGRAAEAATWDGEAARLSDSIDRLDDGVTVRYVRLDACL